MKVYKDLDKDWSEEFILYDLIKIFQPVYNGPERLLDKNKIVCYIIHAYNPDSLWLDLKKDRIQNKIKILSNLDADHKSDLYAGIINNNNNLVNISVFNFLEELKDWRWRSIFDLLEYAARMSRFASMETEEEKKYEKTGKDGAVTKYTEEVDIAIITKVNKEKGILIQQSIDARKSANELMEQLRKEFVATDNGTQQDFGFAFTETAKKKDILSWRHFIKNIKSEPIPE